MLDKLVINLAFQVEMHQVLLDILDQEKELPASCSLLELREIQSIRDQAVLRISELESSRLRVVEEYKYVNDIRQDIRLDNIIETCEPGDQKRLNDLRQKLKNLIRRIQSAGRQNAEKAVARIGCFRELQNSVHKSFNRHSIYSDDGIMTQPKGACLVQKSI